MASEPGLRNCKLRGPVITGSEGESAEMDIWYKGMDLSSLLEVEECGGKFRDRGQEKNALEILKDYGMNLVRLRLWNDPYDEDGNPYGAGTNDLSRTMIMAGRVKKLGLPWLLDIHYSDFWVDPGKQCVPKAWKNYNEEELATAVYSYTGEVLIKLRESDLLPQIVINSFDDYKDNGIIDGFAGSTLVFPISIIILIASIVGIIMIIKGKNRIIRTFGIVTIVALCIFMPICNVHRSGGIAGIVENKDCSLVICYNKSN